MNPNKIGDHIAGDLSSATRNAYGGGLPRFPYISDICTDTAGTLINQFKTYVEILLRFSSGALHGATF